MDGYVNCAHRGGVVTQRRGWPVSRVWGVAYEGRRVGGSSWHVIHLPTGRAVEAPTEAAWCGRRGCRWLCMSTPDAEALAFNLALACDTVGGVFGGEPQFPSGAAARCKRMVDFAVKDSLEGREVGIFTRYPEEPERCDST